MVIGFNHKKGFLLGEHLTHTFSPQIHNKLADYSYGIAELKKEELSTFINEKSYDYLNITIPYKKEVIPFLSELSDSAKKIGSVNTVKKLADGTLKGYNTDYYGFEYLIKKSGINVADTKVLVLGTGGASLTVCAVLRDMNVREIITISRNGENNYNNISIHNDADIIVNTTPVGMYPNNYISPISLDAFKKCRGVIDVIYNPALTQLLLDAERLGINHIGGLPMLVAQAKKAAEIFTDTIIDDAEIDKITKAIEEQTENIILIGMPGCGKSTVGKHIANILERDFFDADDVFYDTYGKTPKQIIETLGEKEFRLMEHKILLELGKKSSCVIATGGGAVTIKENYPPLHQNGKIFYIDRELSMLPTVNRPISKLVGVQELYKARHPLYLSFCDETVQSLKTPTDTANQIISKFITENKNENPCN